MVSNTTETLLESALSLSPHSRFYESDDDDHDAKA